MKKSLKFIGTASGVLLALVLLLILYLAIYPNFSEVRKRCNKIEVGMSRDQVVLILGELMTESDLVSDTKNTIGIVNDIVSCQVRFDENNIVEEVTSTVDGF